MAILMIEVLEMEWPLWQFSMYAWSRTDQFVKSFKEKHHIRIRVRSYNHTEKHDVQKCKMQYMSHQNTVITSKRRHFLLPSSACAPLMMSVFSHLIIAFACVLPLWLIAGPKKRGNQNNISSTLSVSLLPSFFIFIPLA